MAIIVHPLFLFLSFLHMKMMPCFFPHGRYFFMSKIKSPGTICPPHTFICTCVGGWFCTFYISESYELLSSLSTALKNYFYLVYDQNYSVQKFELKPLQFSQLAGGYCWIAFTFLHLLLNIASIFSSKEVINFCNPFCPTWITSNTPLRRLWFIFSDIWGSNPSLRRQLQH